MTRKAIFANKGWYPNTETQLSKALSEYISTDELATDAFACLVPHAGYSYSGPVAGAVFSRIVVPKSAIVLSVKHRASSNAPQFSLWSGGPWETPVGTAEIDEELRSRLLDSTDIFKGDESSHMDEHSGELQIPFLIARNPEVKINVLAVSSHNRDALIQAGEAIARAVKDMGRNILLVGSGDMSHEQFQTSEHNKSQDEKVFPYINALDAQGFFKSVSDNNVTTCGSGTFTITLAAAKALGATKAELVRYDSSARDDGVQDYVVSYAGFVIS